MKRPERFFEWIDGELAGTVETLKFISEMDGEYFYNFESGEICNSRFISPMTLDDLKLKNKFMVEVTDPSNIWRREAIKGRVYKDEEHEVTYQIPSLEDIVQATGNECEVKTELKTHKLVAPYNPRITYTSLPSYEMYKEEERPTVAEPVVAAPTPVQETKAEAPVTSATDTVIAVNEPVTVTKPSEAVSDPVTILVNKCKKHETDVNMTVTIELPSKSVYDIATDEFEDGDEKFIDCVVNSIDTAEIINSLRVALKAAYSEKEEEKIIR